MGLPGTLSLDEPKSGLHLEIEGACLVRPLDAGQPGAATCPELIEGALDSAAVAIVVGDGGSARYSVTIVTDPLESGTGEERARRVAQKSAGDLVEPPTVVTFADQRFVRGRLRGKESGGVCFVTADDRPEVAAIVFLAFDTDPAAVADVERKADLAMATLQRAPLEKAAHGAAPSRGGDTLLVVFVLVVVGLFVLFVAAKFLFIARLLGFKLGGSAERRTEDPRGPRDPEKDGPQVAGMKCAACRKNIVSDREGMHCADCDRPIHKECHGKHVTAAHVATPGAYR
jgi:hypothetical protein